MGVPVMTTRQRAGIACSAFDNCVDGHRPFVTAAATVAATRSQRAAAATVAPAAVGSTRRRRAQQQLTLVVQHHPVRCDKHAAWPSRRHNRAQRRVALAAAAAAAVKRVRSAREPARGQLLLPVCEQRLGRNDQHTACCGGCAATPTVPATTAIATAAARIASGQRARCKCGALHRLSEAHVVAEDAAGARRV
eukprot:354789-Chlamydomonas_euryale.AAC.4